MSDNEVMPPDYGMHQLVRRIHAHLKQSSSHLSAWRKDAAEWYDIYSCEQWSDTDKSFLEEQGRPAMTFNRAGVVIDIVAGSEINNRSEVRYIPREVGDVQANEILTGAAEWVRDECDAEDEESDAFKDSLICGYGWTETAIDYEEDPEGKITVARFDPLEAYYDPTSAKKNLADTRWRARVCRYTPDEFRSRWPEKFQEAMLDDVPGVTLESFPEWAEAEFNERAYDRDEVDIVGFDPNTRTFKVVDYQYFELERFYTTINPATGEMETLSLAAYKRLKGLLDDQGVPVVPQRRRVYKRALICGKVILQDGPAPVDGFTLQCITGKRDRRKNTYYGLIRLMKDPQMWANKFMSQILHIINSQAKGGIMAEADAFEDVEAAQEDWARPDSIVFTQPGAVSQGKITPKPVGGYPQGLDRLMEVSISSIRDVVGVNLEMLGMADRQQPGVLEYQRRQSAMTVLADMFDALRSYRKAHGRVLLQFIQRYISDGRLVRINGDDGTARYVPLAKQPETARYDVIVDEAPSSPNQKDRVFEVMMQLLPVVMKMGIPVPPEVLDYSPLPSSLVEKWKAMLEQAQQQAGESGGADPKDMAQAQNYMAQSELNKAKAQQILQEMGVLPQRMQIEMAKASTGPALESPTEQAKGAADISLKQAQALKAMFEALNERNLSKERVEADARLKVAEKQAEARAQKLNGKAED